MTQETPEAQSLGMGRREERKLEQHAAAGGNNQIQNLPGTSTNEARAPTLHGSAAQVNADSVNSVLQRR